MTKLLICGLEFLAISPNIIYEVQTMSEMLEKDMVTSSIDDIFTKLLGIPVNMPNLYERVKTASDPAIGDVYVKTTEKNGTKTTNAVFILPGFERDEIDVNVNNAVVTVQAKMKTDRYFGAISPEQFLKVELPEGFYSGSSFKTSFQNGVLVVTATAQTKRNGFKLRVE